MRISVVLYTRLKSKPACYGIDGRFRNICDRDAGPGPCASSSIVDCLEFTVPGQSHTISNVTLVYTSGRPSFRATPDIQKYSKSKHGAYRTLECRSRFGNSRDHSSGLDFEIIIWAPKSRFRNPQIPSSVDRTTVAFFGGGRYLRVQLVNPFRPTILQIPSATSSPHPFCVDSLVFHRGEGC